MLQATTDIKSDDDDDDDDDDDEDSDEEEVCVFYNSFFFLMIFWMLYVSNYIIYVFPIFYSNINQIITQMHNV